MSQFEIEVKNHNLDSVTPTNTEDTTVISVPDTGQRAMTNENSSTTTYLMAFATILIISLVAFSFHRFHKILKTPPRTSLFLSRRKTQVSLIIFTFLIASISSFVITKEANGNLHVANAATNTSTASNDETTSTLSVTTTGGKSSVDIYENSAYSIIKDTIMVTESTNFGYTLAVYATGSELTADNVDYTIPATSADTPSILEENSWGFSTVEPTLSDVSEIIWQKIPNITEDLILLKDTGYQPTLAGENIDVYYGVHFSPDTPSGTYVSPTINYLAIANAPLEAAITLDANGATDSSSTQQIITSGLSATLLAPNYARSGYGFLGWSEDQDAFNHLDTAKIYGPNETIYVDGLTPEMTLYAVWLASVGSLQEWNGCSNLSTGDTVALTDSRDNNTYAVAKLKDGNCWMTENLRLGSDTETTLTAEDTQTAGILPAAISSWSLNSSLTIKRLNTSNLTSESGTYLYGNYYNWAATINSLSAVDSGRATTSICPSGWSLPIGGNNADDTDQSFAYLDIQLGGNGSTGANNADISNIWRSYPNNFTLSGAWNGNASPTSGEEGFYWSLSAYDSYSAYRMSLSRNSVNPGLTSIIKNYGGSIRCIKD